MTSDSTVDTAASSPCETCPGPAACRLSRMDARSAYVDGCRAPEARTANTAYTRARRAQRRAQGLTGAVSEWDAPEPERKPEATGEPCPVCGEPLTWTVSRAGQTCANDHFRLPPDSAELAADTIRARSRAAIVTPAETGPSVGELAALAADADRVIRLCREALAALDTSEWEECVRAGLTSAVPGWSEEIAANLRARFTALIGFAGRAESREYLTEIETEYRTLISLPAFGTIYTNIQVELRQIADNLAHRSQGTMRYWVSPDANRIQRAEITPQVSMIPDRKPVITGQVIRDGKTGRITPLASYWDIPRAIAGKANGGDYDDEEYEDDDYDDEEYEERTRYQAPRRVIYDDNESNGNTLFAIVICVGAVIAFVVIVKKAGEWWNRDEFITCRNPDHSGRPALAREHWRGITAQTFTCHKQECREWGHAVTIANTGYGSPIEPEPRPLSDTAGNLAYEITPRGKYRRNKTFTGARQ